MGRYLNQCCCGCTLRTGALIIGIISSIVAILDVIRFFSQHEDLTTALPRFVVTIIELIVSLLLVFGAYKNNAKLLLPYLFFTIVALIVYAVLGVWSGLAIVANNLGAAVSIWISTAVVCCLALFCIWVVYSFHAELTGKLVTVNTV